jgi:hypothetical protein
MMIYQQEMLTTTFAPLDVASPTARRKNLTGSSKKHRSVNFSACTKNGALHPHDEDGHDSSQQQRAGVKRRSSTPRVLIPNALFRSPSELQLSVDEEVAEARDYNFFARLVSGIAERSTSFPHPSTTAITDTSTAAGAYSADTESCLTHILQTRQQQNTGIQHDDAGGCSILEAQQHHEQEQEQNEHDWFTASCSSSTTSSSSHAMYYQHDFDEHTESPYEAEEGAENDCIFDLEL